MANNKIAGEALERMASAIRPFDTDSTRERYRRREFPRAEMVKDVNRRYRWDLFYAAGSGRILPDNEELNDSHIETALRKIVPDL